MVFLLHHLVTKGTTEIKFIFDFLCLYHFFTVFQRPQNLPPNNQHSMSDAINTSRGSNRGCGWTANEQIIVNKWLVILR